MDVSLPKTKSPSLFKETIYTLGVRFFVLLLALAISVFIARVLGPTRNGTYNLVSLLITTLALLISFGIPTSNVYFGARKPEEIPTLLGNSLVAAIVLALIASMLFIAATLLPPIANYLTANDIELAWIRILIFTLVPIQINNYVTEILRAAGQIRKYILISFWRQALAFMSLVGFILFIEGKLEAVIIAFVVAQVMLAFLVITMALRITGGKIRFDWLMLSRNFRYGIRFYPGSIAQFLNYRLDLFLVGLFLSPTDVGFYALATMLAERLWEIPSAIQMILVYRVAADNENAIRVTRQASRIIASLMAFLCIVIVLVSYPLIYLAYGQAYVPAVSAFVLLIPGIWMLSMGKVMAAFVAGMGKPELATVAVLASLIVTIVCDILFIPHMGINGAAITSSLSYSLFTLILLIYFIRSTRSSILDVVIIQRADVRLLWNQVSKLVKQFTLRASSADARG